MRGVSKKIAAYCLGFMICFLQILPAVYAEENSTNLDLYAQSAVLMDADSGRVLYEKNGYEQLAMASTTKIMTCIVALEKGNPADYVPVSAYAAGMPKVKLYARQGEYFKLEDLLYSLMLESHNDSAVAIAEHIAGSTEEFAVLMNQKAKEIGCRNTCFITPNGLDAATKDGSKVHSTTAAELALIMSYCITDSPKKDEFLKITRTAAHAFSNYRENNGQYQAGSRSFHVNNKNAFLNMMDGALSGKTGFTNKAGYCYIGALERDGRMFVVALLACGWPNHKNYKWSDTIELMNYGLENYFYRNVYRDVAIEEIEVADGIPRTGSPYERAYAKAEVDTGGEREINRLLKAEEEVDVKVSMPAVLPAPVTAGEQIGSVTYCLGEEVLKEYPIIISEQIKEKSLKWMIGYIFKAFSL